MFVNLGRVILQASITFRSSQRADLCMRQGQWRAGAATSYLKTNEEVNEEEHVGVHL